MKNLIVFFFFLCGVNCFPQDIVNTLSPGGVFSIKDVTKTFLSLKQSDGYIGIGTANPTHPFEVNAITQKYAGWFTADSIGVYGEGSWNGVYGKGSWNGVYGEGIVQGVYGHGTYGVLGQGPYGVYGDGTLYGVYGVGYNYGVYAKGGNIGLSIGLYAFDTTWYAAWFDGDVRVIGEFWVSGGPKYFQIDHPLDPANKYLMHSCVESSEAMNIYNGNIITDGDGFATVTLPNWFEALNKDFRYQLTVIGSFAQAIISKKIQNNQFEIRTDKSGVEVSWQVSGVRNDAYMKMHPMQIEAEKTGDEKGKYLHPDAFGLPETMGISYKHTRKIEETENKK